MYDKKIEKVPCSSFDDSKSTLKIFDLEELLDG